MVVALGLHQIAACLGKVPFVHHDAGEASLGIREITEREVGGAA